MTQTPLVSIVIVCYNQARFLADAIESVLAQTYTNLEILLIDDGSTDDTAQVALRYPRVGYLRTPNRGLPAARNLGLLSIAGQFVLFLDADDRLLPEAVQAGVNCFHHSPAAAFVCGAFRNIHEDGSASSTPPQLRVRSQHYLRLLEGNFIGMHGAVLYRRDLLREEGGFNESLKACEDYELYLRLTRRWPMAQHTAVVAEYRRHNAGMSRNVPFMLRSVLSVLRRERPFLVDAEHRHALRRGISTWKDYYFRQEFDAWKRDRQPAQLWQAFRLHPAALFKSALRRALASFSPSSVRMGTLRRLSPVSPCFGFDRGQPIDRYYIEAFLADNSAAIHGHVLEIGDDEYSRRFGASRVTRQDVLHIEPGFPGATLIADLANAPHLPSEQFDCIVLTQTLHYIFDLDAALATLHRILKPGGTLLATLPGISRLCTDQADKKSDCWRFTVASAHRLFARHFELPLTSVASHGNVLSAVAFLQGLATHELHRHELDHYDPNFPVTITVSAVRKPVNHESPSPSLENPGLALPPDRPRELRSLVALRDA